MNFERKPVLPMSDKSAAEFFKTGDWRTFKPEMRQKNSACRAACPIHNQIRDCLQLVKERKYEEAWQKIIETNPLPAVLGRICPHPCEAECLRSHLDQPLAINTIEKILGDIALESGWKPKVKELTPRLLSRKRIAIIGAGPAGLACAYQLRRLGYWLEIFEAEKKPGGMLYFGIPSFRLPKDILFSEIENNIISLDGIKIHLETEIISIMWHHFLSDFDAVLVAVGNKKSKKLNIPGEENPQVLSGLDFLRKVNIGIGEKNSFKDSIVAVIGGGNTAVDASRLAKKIGARSVFILYRRREEDMPAFSDEIKAAKNEGIEIIPLVAPLEIEKKQDNILRIECCRISLGENDKSGRPKPVLMLGTDSRYTAFCHYLIVAIGEESDLSFTKTSEEKLLFENVFSAGDASIYGAGTVSAAIGSANKVAKEIDWYLRTGQRKEIPEEKQKIVQFDDLNSAYFKFIRSRLCIHSLTGDRKILEQLLQEESERCFSCGACNSCGNCWLYCPDVVVKKTEENKFEINYEYCKGCGICANECPRNVIDMEREVKQ